jgi:membrane-bound lytic murein transglycosylase D
LKYIQKAHIFVFFIFFLVLFNCASTPKIAKKTNQKISIKSNVIEKDTTNFSDSNFVFADSIDTFSYNEEDSIFESPEVLIEEAKSYCDSQKYEKADSVLKIALKAIQNIDLESDSATSEWFPSSQYLDDIVTIYKEKMPANFPMPEELTIGVFQHQMMKSLDSIKVIVSDSLISAAIACQKNISYDIPIEWNQRVQKALFYYIKNRDITIDKWFLRAKNYIPIFKKIFADSSLPLDLVYLPLIESSFNPLAYSYAHASGIWQFIASTGKIYGLNRSFWIDERRDPIRSAQAAASYLKKLYKDFGNWHLALAAYNYGENGLARAIFNQNTNDYWKLKKIPNQTKNYVPCFLASLIIAKNPECFGIQIPKADSIPFDTVILNQQCISLQDISEGLKIDYDTLKKLNPHIMRWCTPPDVSNVILYLPPGKKNQWNYFVSNLPKEKLVKWLRYQIKPNETLESIATKFNVAKESLIKINRLNSLKLKTGYHLFVPISDTIFDANVAYSLPPESEIKALDLTDYDFSGVVLRHRVRKGECLGTIARKYRVTVNQLCRWNRITGRTILRPGRILIVSRPKPVYETQPSTVYADKKSNTNNIPILHEVKIGDTPFSISRKYNITVKELAQLNNLDLSHPRIFIGQKLVVSPQLATNIPKKDSMVNNLTTKDSLYDNIYSPNDSNNWNIDSLNYSFSDSLKAKTSSLPKYHIVEKGENLFRISQKYSVGISDLVFANKLNNKHIISAGDTLIIPQPAFNNSNNFSVSQTDTLSYQIVYYKVKEGDTLLKIAAAFGIPLEKLSKDNNLNPDSVIFPGNIIKVVAK